MRKKKLDGIEIVTYEDVMYDIFGSYWPYEPLEEGYDGWNRWQAIHDAAYYAAPRKTFDLEAAIALAKKNGRPLVVVNMLD